MATTDSSPKRPTGPENPESWFTPRRVVLFLVGLALTCTAVVFGGPRAWHRWQNHEAESLSQKSAACLKAGEFEEASRLAGEAYKKSPGNRSTLRTLARLFDQSSGGADRAAFLWQQLAGLPGAAAEDQVGLAGALLRLGRNDEVRAILEKLPREARGSRPALELQAGILRSEGRTAEAESKLREAYALTPNDPDARLRLCQLDLASPFREVQERAEQGVWRLAKEPDHDTAVRALVVLSERPGIAPSAAAELRSRLGELDAVPERLRLGILAGCIRGAPLLKDEIIDAESDRLKEASPEKQVPFFQWLLQVGEARRVLGLVDAEMAQRSAALLEIYVTAMTKTGRNEALRQFIRNTPGLPLSPARLSILQARSASSVNAPAAEIRSHLQEAVKHAAAAAGQTELTAVAEAADALGQEDIAVDTLNIIAEQPQLRLLTLERILRIHQRQRNLPAMLATTERCLAEKPGLSPYAETACYLRLLSGEAMELTAADALRLGDTGRPLSPAIHLVRALAAYRAANYTLAAKESDSIDPSKLGAGQRAVLSGILNACGRSSEAYQLAEKVPGSIILNEEAGFLKRAL